MPNKTKYALLLLLIVLIAGFFYWRNFMRAPVADEQEQQIEQPIPGQTILPTDQLPQGITSEMILEENPTIVDSFTYDDEGQIQSTIRFLSPKTIEQLKKEYNDYLEKNKWEVEPQEEGSAGLVSITASLDQSRLYITVSPYNDAETVVDLTLVN